MGFATGLCEQRRTARTEYNDIIREANLLENARSIMEAFRLTAQQALDVLKVPEADWPRLMELL